MGDTKHSDPAFNVMPDRMGGHYTDVNGKTQDITITFEYPENTDSSIKVPLTKREYFSVEILRGLLTESSQKYVSLTDEEICNKAVRLADTLVSQLNNQPIP
jgi:hypothetical protein